MSTLRIDFTLTTLPDGRVLAAGGSVLESTSAGVTSTEIFDPKAGTWAPAASMNQPRSSQTALALDDGRVLMIAGADDGSSEIYDPSSDTWTTTAHSPCNLFAHAALLPGGKALAFTEYGGVQGCAAVYDVGTDSWTTAPATLVRRSDSSAVTLADGRVLVAGGLTPMSNGTNLILASAEIYDPKSNAWSFTGTMTAAHAEYTVALLDDGTVIVAGGDQAGSGDALDPINLVDRFDPAKGVWSAVAPMSMPRDASTLTRRLDGTVLAVGGWHAVGAEFFDPIAGTWVSAPPPLVDRWEATATLLHDGSVLVAGGLDENYHGLASAEILGPGTLARTTTGAGGATPSGAGGAVSATVPPGNEQGPKAFTGCYCATRAEAEGSRGAWLVAAGAFALTALFRRRLTHGSKRGRRPRRAIPGSKPRPECRDRFGA